MILKLEKVELEIGTSGKPPWNLGGLEKANQTFSHSAERDGDAYTISSNFHLLPKNRVVDWPSFLWRNLVD